MSDVQIHLDFAKLRPLVEEIVAEVLAKAGQLGGADGRMAYTEPEAASLLGMTARQLAEQRRVRRLSHSRGPKNSVRYTRDDLKNYLASRHEPA